MRKIYRGVRVEIVRHSVPLIIQVHRHVDLFVAGHGSVGVEAEVGESLNETRALVFRVLSS